MHSTSRPHPLLWPGFWLAACGFYVWYFGRTAGSWLGILDLAIPLLLIAMGTSWMMGSFLIPRYLLRGRPGHVALYALYTLVVSTHLVLAVVVGVFMSSGYSMHRMAPAALDRPALVVGVFVVVALSVVVSLVLSWRELKASLDEVALEKRQAEEQLDRARADIRASVEADDTFLEFQVDRRTVRLRPEEISYLESAADYVLVATGEDRLITKARIGDLAESMAHLGFVRVHRSFVVRLDAVDSFTSTEVEINGTSIPVSRTYRRDVLERLED